MPVQSIRFERKNWSVTQAKQWLRQHNFEGREVDITASELRFRQYTPKKGERYFTKKTGEGIRFIFGYPRKPKKRAAAS